MRTNSGPETTGSCLCGGVRYRVMGPLRSIVYCHRSQCRRTSGKFVAGTTVAKDTLLVVADKVLTGSRPRICGVRVLHTLRFEPVLASLG